MQPLSRLILFIQAVFYLVSCTSVELNVRLTNPLNMPRVGAIIEIDRSMIENHLNCDEPIVAVSAEDQKVIPTQLLDLDGNGEWETLLIQISVGAREYRNMSLRNSDLNEASFKSLVYGRFVPERKDDFAWENDRIAFRMYGPALKADSEISSGVDVWVKSVTYPIIDKWYALGQYHSDHGEGADLYKVGPSLGCGGLGLLYGDTLYTSRNFTDYRILAQGPLRFVFELDYEAWGPDSLEIHETKRITLDAGQHFNRMTSRLKFSGTWPESARIVSGLLAHPSLSQNAVSLDSSDDYMIMFEAFKGDNGFLGTAIIREALAQVEALKKYGDQYLMVLPISEKGTVNYFAGAAWSKSPWIGSEADWQNHVRAFETQLKQPLQLTIINN